MSIVNKIDLIAFEFVNNKKKLKNKIEKKQNINSTSIIKYERKNSCVYSEKLLLVFLYIIIIEFHVNDIFGLICTH
jgi:hypothetical protein